MFVYLMENWPFADFYYLCLLAVANMTSYHSGPLQQAHLHCYGLLYITSSTRFPLPILSSFIYSGNSVGFPNSWAVFHLGLQQAHCQQQHQLDTAATLGSSGTCRLFFLHSWRKIGNCSRFFYAIYVIFPESLGSCWV